MLKNDEERDEKMMLYQPNPQSHIAQSHISTNKQTLPPTQIEPPPFGLPAQHASTKPHSAYWGINNFTI